MSKGQRWQGYRVGKGWSLGYVESKDEKLSNHSLVWILLHYSDYIDMALAPQEEQKNDRNHDNLFLFVFLNQPSPPLPPDTPKDSWTDFCLIKK